MSEHLRPIHQATTASHSQQLPLWGSDSMAPMAEGVENPEYLSRQLITCIGNKRALLGHIGSAVDQVKRRLGKTRLRVFDAFSGSGVVSRFLKAHADWLVSNDVEPYAEAMARCYLRNRSEVNCNALVKAIAELNHQVATTVLPTGFIQELYAPQDETRITRADRVFYTRDNARRLDHYRQLIDAAAPELQAMLLGPLLSQASIRANTAGVFKGFYKNRHTRIGQFGGTGADALSRITGTIQLEAPVLSRFECQCRIERDDANVVARRISELDLAYLDPPYNQHPYGSNYFMLNLLVCYQRPKQISRVSGIPTNWQRSEYNVRARSLPLLKQLLETIDAPFLLISFNNEGFIAPAEMLAMLQRLGTVQTMATPYNAFRGSRSFRNRPIHVTEQLFLLERR